MLWYNIRIIIDLEFQVYNFKRKSFLMFYKVFVIIISGFWLEFFLLIIYVGNATSYLSDKPETCINCHVMYTQYASWRISSNERTQTSNTCHFPKNNIFKKNKVARLKARYAKKVNKKAEPKTVKTTKKM